MLWTILTVVLVVICVGFLLVGPIFPGGKSVGQVQEIGVRLWTGLWKKDDADRLR
ncbi:MAG: hypothetical protein QOG93_746 [Gaiellaceae bacterium]|jgi:hypothetical protein|nr:hypothetical protein [Gaiellaceae bacterium]MDX6388185.1 hypothetical protein [Gaiellaceae bacterium]